MLVAAVLVRPKPLVACLCVVGTLATVNASLRDGSAPALEQAAQGVERCELHGRVTDGSEKLGTIIAIDRMRCPSGDVSSGRVVLDDTTAAIGSTARGEVLLSPVGEEGFDRALRRAGAAARIHGSVEFGPPTAPVHRVALQVRDGVGRAAERVGGDPGALLAGLTVGDTAGMSGLFEQQMRAAGLSHLVAVSGSNVALVTGALYLACARLGRPAAAAIAGLGLGLYVAVVGPDPSVLRAASMGALGLVAMVSGRRTEPAAALACAVALVLIARPTLIDSVGLHLSVAATAGLIAWSGRLSELLPGPRIVSLPLAVTLAAQIAVAPILIAVFEEVSVVGPLANLVAAPAVAPATVLGLGAGLLETLTDGAGAPLVALAAPFVHALAWTGRVTGSPEWAAVDLHRAWAIPLAAAVSVGLVWAVVRRS